MVFLHKLKLITIALILFLPLIFLGRTGILPTAGRFMGMEGNSLIYARGQDAATLDPALAQDEESYKVISNIFEGLVRFKLGTTKIEPCLAEAWRVSPDGLEWTFYLRKNVKFHDGTPFNAEAVRYSIDRQMPPQRAESTPYCAIAFEMVDKIITPDPYTVKFILKFPYSPFLNNLAMPAAAPIVSPTAATALGENFGEKPVGTGPFRFVKWEKGRSIALKEHREYWGKRPECSLLTFTVIKNSRLRSLALKLGIVDLIDGITPSDNHFLEQSDCSVLHKPGLDLNYLGFFTDKAPLDNPAVRKAIALSVDRKQIVAGLLGGTTLEANGPLPPGVLGYDPDMRPLPYDPAGARELLSNSGYPEGIEITIATYKETRPYNPAGGEKLALALQADLARAGIKANIKAYPWRQYKEVLLNKEGDAFLYGWISDNYDPDNFLYTLLSSSQIESGLNTTHYRNNELDLLLAKAQWETDPTLREQMYQEAVHIVNRDFPFFILNHSLKQYATSPAIEGFIPSPTGFTQLGAVKRKPIDTTIYH